MDIGPDAMAIVSLELRGAEPVASDLEPADKLCPTNGQERSRIGRDVTTEYDNVPAKWTICKTGSAQDR